MKKKRQKMKNKRAGKLRAEIDKIAAEDAKAVDEIGPRVAKALSFFREHNIDPQVVVDKLSEDTEEDDAEGVVGWVFTVDEDTLEVDRTTRNMLIFLIAAEA